MAKVETLTGSSVTSYAQDIVRTHDYNYYCLFGVSPTQAILVQSKTYDAERSVYEECQVTQFDFIHDDEDHLTDWRMSVYPAAAYFVDNSESYVMYTNAIKGYPVLRGDSRYDTGYFFAGACGLLLVLTCSLFSFRLFAVNRSG